MSWQLAEAKNKLSEVVTLALTSGPQRICRRNQVVIVLSEADYKSLIGESISFKDYLLNGPDLSELDLERDTSPMREVEW